MEVEVVGGGAAVEGEVERWSRRWRVGREVQCRRRAAAATRWHMALTSGAGAGPPPPTLDTHFLKLCHKTCHNKKTKTKNNLYMYFKVEVSCKTITFRNAGELVGFLAGWLVVKMICWHIIWCVDN